MPNQVNSQPSKININAPLVCYGMSVRTNNNAEMSPDTAKIGTLWQDFYQTLFPNIIETEGKNQQIYGLYYNYENDVNGDFDVMAGVSDVLDEMSNVSLTSMTIPDGNYLVFKQQGKMPQAVITAWQQVWAYFNNANCPHVRKYSVDFEKYIAENEVEVYIAIQ